MSESVLDLLKRVPGFPAALYLTWMGFLLNFKARCCGDTSALVLRAEELGAGAGTPYFAEVDFYSPDASPDSQPPRVDVGPVPFPSPPLLPVSTCLFLHILSYGI